MTFQSTWFDVYFDQEKNISDVAVIMSKGGPGFAPQEVEPAQCTIQIHQYLVPMARVLRSNKSSHHRSSSCHFSLQIPGQPELK